MPSLQIHGGICKLILQSANCRINNKNNQLPSVIIPSAVRWPLVHYSRQCQSTTTRQSELTCVLYCTWWPLFHWSASPPYFTFLVPCHHHYVYKTVCDDPPIVLPHCGKDQKLIVPLPPPPPAPTVVTFRFFYVQGGTRITDNTFYGEL